MALALLTMGFRAVAAVETALPTARSALEPGVIAERDEDIDTPVMPEAPGRVPLEFASDEVVDEEDAIVVVLKFCRRPATIHG